MKKVGIVTMHRSYNYGAVLQAYATQKFFANAGFAPEIIDYTNPYEHQGMKWAYKENNKLSGYIKSFARNLLFGRKYFGYKAFGDFKKYYPLSSNRYTRVDQLHDYSCNILVAGSDQIWNPRITNGLDRTFLLEFGKADKRLSLSSSMGSTPVSSDEEREHFRKALAKFDAISVREEFAKEQIQGLVERDIKVTVDPTFLMTKEEWETLGHSSTVTKKEDYILTYFIGKNKNHYYEMVSRYAERFGLPIYAIQYSAYRISGISKPILGATLEDLVKLISDATLVITDSFHGTAMSLNLQKDFVALNNIENPVRVKALLNMIQLDDRLEMTPDRFIPVDYQIVAPILQSRAEETRKWIMNAIEDRS